REGVHHYVHVHPATGGVDQCLLEPLTDLIVLPDEGFKVHRVPGTFDRFEHSLVQVLAEGVGGDLGAGDLRLARWGAWEDPAGRVTTFAHAINEHHACHGRQVHCRNAADPPSGRSTQGLPTR